MDSASSAPTAQKGTKHSTDTPKSDTGWRFVCDPGAKQMMVVDAAMWGGITSILYVLHPCVCESSVSGALCVRALCVSKCTNWIKGNCDVFRQLLTPVVGMGRAIS